ELGALQYIECVGDDVPTGKLTSFPQAVKLEPDETVIFAWIVYASRAERDRINRAVMQDPRIGGVDTKSMDFDTNRMVWGGFEGLVALKRSAPAACRHRPTGIVLAGERSRSQARKEARHEVHDPGQGQPRLRGRQDAQPRAVEPDGQLQRGVG